MIDTVGLLLELDEECRLSTHVFVDDIVQNWKYLRNQKAYFPYIELLPDGKLKIEFCPARLLHANNLYEICADDMPKVLANLAAYLNKAHVLTCPAILFYAHVYRIDYAKVCYIPFDSQVLLPYLQDIHQGGRYKEAFTFYPNDGHMTASTLKLRKTGFYNKSSEILQNWRNTDDVKDIVNNLPGTFYRFECSLKTAKEIGRELNRCDIDLQTCCLAALSTQTVIYAVLNRNLTQIMHHWYVPDRTKALDRVQIWLCKYKYENVRSLLTDMLYAAVCVQLGVETVRKTVEKHLGKRYARDFMKRFERLELEDENCLAVFKRTWMEEVQTLRPIDKPFVYALERKRTAKDLSLRLFASVLLAIIELLISTPLW